MSTKQSKKQPASQEFWEKRLAEFRKRLKDSGFTVEVMEPGSGTKEYKATFPRAQSRPAKPRKK